jgi:hypothetical protein
LTPFEKTHKSRDSSPLLPNTASLPKKASPVAEKSPFYTGDHDEDMSDYNFSNTPSSITTTTTTKSKATLLGPRRRSKGLLKSLSPIHHQEFTKSNENEPSDVAGEESTVADDKVQSEKDQEEDKVRVDDKKRRRTGRLSISEIKKKADVSATTSSDEVPEPADVTDTSFALDVTNDEDPGSVPISKASSVVSSEEHSEDHIAPAYNKKAPTKTKHKKKGSGLYKRTKKSSKKVVTEVLQESTEEPIEEHTEELIEEPIEEHTEETEEPAEEHSEQQSDEEPEPVKEDSGNESHQEFLPDNAQEDSDKPAESKPDTRVIKQYGKKARAAGTDTVYGKPKLSLKAPVNGKNGVARATKKKPSIWERNLIDEKDLLSQEEQSEWRVMKMLLLVN